MATMKYSRQREVIRHHLAGRRDHPTAEMIYISLKEEDPKLSLGTVYRNLALLTELGEIRKIQAEDGPDHFDGDTTEHYHFICRSCRRIYDLRLTALEGLGERLLSSQDEDRKIGQIDRIALSVTGQCADCCEH